MELLWQLASNKSGGCGSDMVWWRVDTFIRRVDTFSFHDVVGCRWVSLTQKTIYGLHSFDVHEGESHGMQNTTHGVVERGRVARVRGWSQKSYWNFWKIFAKMSKYLYQRAICLNRTQKISDKVTSPNVFQVLEIMGCLTRFSLKNTDRSGQLLKRWSSLARSAPWY